jgi:hypothetical protein
MLQAFNNPNTYVKAAKFQRLANAKEKELAALQTVKEVTVQDRVDTTVSTLMVCGGPVQHAVRTASPFTAVLADVAYTSTPGVEHPPWSCVMTLS